ncbi:MAG: GNAT family N-acetyltransferase [Planctomycetia bacterium]|nr:GNAT family N-acetyltransferase [Planctomycetia bacterium]
MVNTLKVTPVKGFWDRRAYLQFPWEIYRNDPNWVPPLLCMQKGLLGFQKDAYYIRNQIQTFLARRNGKVVGTIAAIVNQGHLEIYNDNRGFFGFFECEDNQETANALFDTAREWLREKGLNRVRGPMNPSINHTMGLLVDGFHLPPRFMMTYNKPYYQKLIENYGFQKAQDAYAFVGDLEMLPGIIGKYTRIADQIKERFGVKIRPLDTSRFDEEIRMFLDVFNRSNSNTWGYVPMSEAELEQEAKGLKTLIVPDLAIFAEIDGKIVGSELCIPDFNPAIRKIKGRLFPFGFMTLLNTKRHFNEIRSISTNVLPEYQMMGIPLLLLQAILPAAEKWGINKAEFSWVLESNDYSRGSLEKAGTIPEKTYRIYDLGD